MSTEIKGMFGSIQGSYKKESSAPLILKPCDHAVIKEERKLKSNLIIRVHGKDNGESSISEHEIGSGNE
ncbi:MAG: hypothetical protein HRU07_06585 [Nitrosopumilus sp.]|nr:hypothetical protein [Nitrosopumilus sp.]NRA05807.1 hypothetical protein [Nitrosopumilus sp.]